MKILKAAKTEGWWVGREIKCDCGFHAVVEAGDVENNETGRFEPMQTMVDYLCVCRRLVTLHQEG
jgi:hypothetical protein